LGLVLANIGVYRYENGRGEKKKDVFGGAAPAQSTNQRKEERGWNSTREKGKRTTTKTRGNGGERKKSTETPMRKERKGASYYRRKTLGAHRVGNAA